MLVAHWLAKFGRPLLLGAQETKYHYQCTTNFSLCLAPGMNFVLPLRPNLNFELVAKNEIF